MGKEKAIELTFGDDTSPHLLEKFIAHYSLIDRINTARCVRVWKKPEYRSLMLRSALRGTAWEFVENAENIMLTTWVKDDREIVRKLREWYITNSATEPRIIKFATTSQLEGEPLSEYMNHIHSAEAYRKGVCFTPTVCKAEESCVAVLEWIEGQICEGGSDQGDVDGRWREG